MKSISLFVVLLLLISVPAYSVLIDNGNGTITDTTTNLTWLQSGTVFGGGTWDEAILWANNLTFAGITDWRLPSALNVDGSGPCLGSSCTDSEFGHLFYSSLGNTIGQPTNTGSFDDMTGLYWTLTETAIDGAVVTSIGSLGGMSQSITGKPSSVSAWAVRGAAPPTPIVPEPISSTLFIIGGATLGFRQWRKIR